MKLSYRYLVFVLGIVLLLFPILAVGCGPQSQAPGTVSSSDSGKVTNPIPKDYAQFEVGALKVARSGVSVGETATVSTSVTNTGGIPGIYKAVLTIDGKQADQKDVSVGPGESQSVSFQVTKTAPGTYELAIDNSSATLNVYKWPYTIQYDLGNVAQQSLSLSGDYGHIVHFTPPATPFKIQKIDVYGQANVNKDSDWYDRFVTVRIWNSDRTQQLWSANFPWRDFWNDVGSFWKEIQVPNVSANGDFYVEIVTHSDQFGGEIGSAPSGPDFKPAIFVAYDRPNPYQTSTVSTTLTPSGISKMGQPVEVPVKYQGLNWLIRVEGDGSL